jgi:hypothetical protein
MRIVRMLGWVIASLAVGLAFARSGLVFADQGGPAAVAGIAEPEPNFGTGAFDLMLTVVFVGVGAFLSSRRTRNPIGWLLITTGTAFSVMLFVERLGWHFMLADSRVGDGAAAALWMANWAWIPAVIPMFVGIPILFPTGRPLSPRWGRFLALVLANVAAFTFATMFATGPVENYLPVDNPFGLGAWLTTVRDLTFAVLLVTAMISVSSLFLRFHRARGVEREQIKWVWAAGVVLLGTFVVNGVFENSHPEIAGNVFIVGVLSLPVAIAVAMLRYRLYDVDVVVNRTLVYGGLTAALALVYLGGVLLFGVLLAPVTSDSGLAVAISTLAVAALFRPIRARIQALVDRRFYRRRYDAVRTLDAFNARLRDEIDLDSLVRELGSVVDATVQPAHVSLWLRSRIHGPSAVGRATSPAAKRGPRTNGPSPRNGRSTPGVRKPADEVLHSSRDMAVADSRPRHQTSALRDQR